MYFEPERWYDRVWARGDSRSVFGGSAGLWFRVCLCGKRPVDNAAGVRVCECVCVVESECWSGCVGRWL